MGRKETEVEEEMKDVWLQGLMEETPSRRWWALAAASERSKGMKTKRRKGGSLSWEPFQGAWPPPSYGKRTSIVISLQPPSSLSPDLHFPLPPYSIGGSNLASELPTPSTPSLQPPDSQTGRPQTHSLALSFLGSPPSTQTVILDSSLPLPAHLNDPLSISWTKLSSLTLRVQPQSNLPPLLSTLIHLPLNPASSPSSILNTIRPSDSYLTPHSHSCQNKSNLFKILQIMKQ